MFGGKLIVESAVAIARQIGITELLISSTIIAVGTSLPELATSVMAAVRKDPMLAVGNVVGSNIFNIFLVLGATSAIMPIDFFPSLNIDLFFLVAVSMLFFGFSIFGKRYRMDRWQGIIFLALYAAYVCFLVWRG